MPIKTAAPILAPKPTVTAQLFSRPQLIFRIFLKFGSLFILIFIITFTLINFPALSKKLNYFWSNSFRGQSITPSPTFPPLDPTSPAQLSIPALSITAPISWEVDEANLNARLLEGVVHYKGTALPGNIGNVFIVGHSSYYAWADSQYKDIFAILDEIKVGDKIYIHYQSADFTYEVTDLKVVSPTNLEVMQSTNEHILTLMTCVPVGTNLRRLVVTAKQVTANGLF